MSPRTLCRCIDLTSVHHVVCAHVCVRYQSNTCCLMSISSSFSLQRVLNICMSVAVGGKFWHFFLGCLYLLLSFLNLFFSFDLCPPRCSSSRATFSIHFIVPYSFPVLCVCPFIFAPLLIHPVNKILHLNTNKSICMTANQYHKSRSSFSAVCKQIHCFNVSVCCVRSKQWRLQWQLYFRGFFFYTEELHASIDAFLQVKWHSTSRVTVDVSPPLPSYLSRCSQTSVTVFVSKAVRS